MTQLVAEQVLHPKLSDSKLECLMTVLLLFGSFHPMKLVPKE